MKAATFEGFHGGQALMAKRSRCGEVEGAIASETGTRTATEISWFDWTRGIGEIRSALAKFA
jgi:hypothetical protein